MASCPRISVCMATHNGERFLVRQVESVLRALGDDEVVISDDSSTDGTLGLIRGFGDKRITLLDGNTFFNPIFNFENALRHSRGELIVLCDQDDLWKPQKIEVLLPLLQRYDLVLSDCEIIDEDDRLLHPSFFALHGSRPGVVRNILHNSFMGCCMAFRRSLLDAALPFPADVPMHDMWIGLIASLISTVHFCPEPLVQYRKHGANRSTTSEPSPFTFAEKVVLGKNFVWNLALRMIELRRRKKV